MTRIIDALYDFLRAPARVEGDTVVISLAAYRRLYEVVRREDPEALPSGPAPR